ncbi:MAG: hypothetical protein ACKOTE_12785, partial [Opitutaceae bacterium]
MPSLDPRRPAGAPEIAFHDSREVLGLPGPGRIAPTPERVAEMRHGYFANISYLDAQLGKVLDALDRSGRAAPSRVRGRSRRDADAACRPRPSPWRPGHARP